jgi:hypothetical protein
LSAGKRVSQLHFAYPFFIFISFQSLTPVVLIPPQGLRYHHLAAGAEPTYSRISPATEVFSPKKQSFAPQLVPVLRPFVIGMVLVGASSNNF